MWTSGSRYISRYSSKQKGGCGMAAEGLAGSLRLPLILEIRITGSSRSRRRGSSATTSSVTTLVFRRPRRPRRHPLSPHQKIKRAFQARENNLTVIIASHASLKAGGPWRCDNGPHAPRPTLVMGYRPPPPWHGHRQGPTARTPGTTHSCR